MSTSYTKRITRTISDIADEYERFSGLVTLGLLNLYRRAAARHVVGADLLDVGGGQGEMLAVLGRRSLRRAVVLDPSVEMLRAAAGSSDVVVGVAEALPFRESSFETVVSAFALRHVDIAAFIFELRRVARRRAVILDFWGNDNVAVYALEVIYVALLSFIAALIVNPRKLRSFMTLPVTMVGRPRLAYVLRLFSALGHVNVQCWFLCNVFVVSVDFN